jgi:hypothetical protein
LKVRGAELEIDVVERVAFPDEIGSAELAFEIVLNRATVRRHDVRKRLGDGKCWFGNGAPERNGEGKALRLVAAAARATSDRAAAVPEQHETLDAKAPVGLCDHTRR